MKRVPRLGSQPRSLSDYCSANAADVAADATSSNAVWTRFRRRQSYRLTRDALVAAQQGLCAYCEQCLTGDDGELILNDQQIEHVLPKTGGTGRTLDWTNFVLCCGGGTWGHHKDTTRHSGSRNISCGQAKGKTDLPQGCDPRDFPCMPRLVDVGLDGTLAASPAVCESAGIDAVELNRAINEVLNLNCERLKMARSKVANNIRTLIVSLDEELQGMMNLREPQRATLWELVAAGRLQLDIHGHLRAFWTTERQYLEPWSMAWINNNRATLGC